MRAEPATLRAALFDELDAPGSITKSRIRNLLIRYPETGPRTITTVEELDALPGGSIIQDAKGIGWQKYNKVAEKPAWLPATRQEGFYFSSNLVDADRTPATILHVGGTE